MTNEELIISLQHQTRKEIGSLSKSMSRTNARVAANGVKLDVVIDYNQKCDERLGELEEWKAGHVGFAAGKSRKSKVFGSNVTLICVVGTMLIAFASLWFTYVSPTLAATDQKYEAVLDALESLKP